MVSHKKPVSIGIAEAFIYSSYFEQTVGEESRIIATEDRRSRSICHGMTQKDTEKTEAETRKENQEEAEAFATDEHGKTRKENTS